MVGLAVVRICQDGYPPIAAVIIYYSVVLYLLWYAPLKGIKANKAYIVAFAAVCLMYVVRPACLEGCF